MSKIGGLRKYMDFEKMTTEEVKEYAKSIGLSFGNIGRDKLIEKIKAKEVENISESVFGESDFQKPEKEVVEDPNITKPSTSVLESISSAIDDLENADKEEIVVEDIPNNTVIPVKSITFGGLTYKSRINNAMFRWDRIGAVEYMTVEQLNEMNNYKRDFLNKPYVILMDERAIRKFRLTKIYENVAKINDLKNIFKSDRETIKSTIKMAVDVNMRDILISKVSQMIKTGSLVDINVIRLLKEELSYDFDDLLDNNIE